MSNDIFLHNYSQVAGSAVDNSGTVTVDGCTFQANNGPAVQSAYGITSVDNSYFTQNTAYYGGAAIYVYAGTLYMSCPLQKAPQSSLCRG